MPVGENATSFPTWNVTVNNTAPLWFYCRQHTPAGASHCGAGMVFAVNAVEDSPRNFSAFRSLATTLNGTNVSSAAGNNTSGGSDNGASAGSAFSVALFLGAAVAAAAVLL